MFWAGRLSTNQNWVEKPRSGEILQKSVSCGQDTTKCFLAVTEKDCDLWGQQWCSICFQHFTKLSTNIREYDNIYGSNTYLLLNLDVSLLRSEGLPPGPKGSVPLSGPFWVRGRVWPLWKVLRAVIFLVPSREGWVWISELGFALLEEIDGHNNN